MSSFNDKEESNSISDKLLSSMLRPKEVSKSKGPLIQDLSVPCVEEDVFEIVPGEATDVSVKKSSTSASTSVPYASTAPISNPSALQNEGPTLMDEILAAQAEAARAKKIAEEVAAKKNAKTFGGGFKKGFFGGDNTTSSSGANKSGSSKTLTEEIPTIRKASGNISKAVNLSKVNEEVQRGMAEDKSALALELEKGTWITPELLKQFQANPVISQGLQNARCKHALEMMQKNPKEAQAKYSNDKEVDTFLREFGKLMGSHFDGLAAKQELGQKQDSQSAAKVGNTSVGINAVKTVTKNVVEKKTDTLPIGAGGVLLEQAKARQAKTAPRSAAEQAAEDERVQKVINNPELTALLMDPKMQMVLQECGDPVKFQRIMRDPVMAANIKKLFDAGLVSMGK